MVTVSHPEVFIRYFECQRRLKTQLTFGRSFTRLDNGFPRGETPWVSIWDELRQSQDASVLSNQGFLSLQFCLHHVGARCGGSLC